MARGAIGRSADSTRGGGATVEDGHDVIGAAPIGGAPGAARRAVRHGSAREGV